MWVESMPVPTLGWSSGNRGKGVGLGRGEKGLQPVFAIFYFFNNSKKRMRSKNGQVVTFVNFEWRVHGS